VVGSVFVILGDWGQYIYSYIIHLQSQHPYTRNLVTNIPIFDLQIAFSVNLTYIYCDSSLRPLLVPTL
jgi:hypothetical protein